MGQGLETTGAISAEGLDRVTAALTDHRDLIVAAGVSNIRVVATSAAREASNRDELFALVGATLGVEAELLSGGDEGRYGFAGAVVSTDAADEGALLIDIGGGSTEFVLGTSLTGVSGVYSADVGASRVTDSYFESDPPRPEELSAALSVVELHIADVRRNLPAVDAVIEDGVVVGVGGTITTVAAVELGLVTYDSTRVDGFILERVAVEDVFRTVATESRADRRFNPGLPEDRVDLIVGGCAVLVEVMRRLGIDEIRVSESDLLDGIAAEMSKG